MRTYNSNNNYDVIEAKKHNVPDWQLKLLELNPEYPYWGNFEDHMSSGVSWASPITYHSFSEMFQLDSLNECVNFYFQVIRKNGLCPHCEGTGLNKLTKQIDDDWYDFNCTGNQWNHSITDHEVKALVKGGRISELIKGDWTHFNDEKQCWEKLDRSLIDEENPRGKWITCDEPVYPTAMEVNEWSFHGMAHDAINKSICVQARAEREGVFGNCEYCDGEGREFLEPESHVSLQLWIIHPRKGASRGVYIENITENDLPQVYEFLNNAAERNKKRFEKISCIFK